MTFSGQICLNCIVPPHQTFLEFPLFFTNLYSIAPLSILIQFYAKMSTSTNEEHQGTEDIRSVNLDKIRHDQDKLYHAAVGLQHEVKRLHGNQEIARQRESVQSTLSGYTPKSNTPEPSAFWSGLQWIPAEWDYPSEDASAEFSCFGNSQMDVLVYDCLNSELRVWPGLSQLQGSSFLEKDAKINSADDKHREKSPLCKTPVKVVLAAPGLCREDHHNGGKKCAKIQDY